MFCPNWEVFVAPFKKTSIAGENAYKNTNFRPVSRYFTIISSSCYGSFFFQFHFANGHKTCRMRYLYYDFHFLLKSADNFSRVWFSPCLWRFCLALGLESLDMTCMQTPSPYPVRSRGLDQSISEGCCFMITEDRIESNLSKTKNIPPKRWFSQIIVVPLPCHWWFCLSWFAALR